MGAEAFSIILVVKGDVKLAYREAVTEANDYNGHQDGYSGDIQTVDGYKQARGYPRYGSKAFQDWLDKKLCEMDKRDCEFVEITGSRLVKIKESSGLKGKKGYRAFLFFGLGAC